MSLNKLKDFLAQNNQRFICSDGGSGQYEAAVEHRSDPALTEREMKSLKERVGPLEELVEFYSAYGSLRLYCDVNSSSSAFYIARPGEWDQLKQECRSWVTMLGGSDVPDWFDAAIVIGEIPEAGNYLLVATSG